MGEGDEIVARSLALLSLLIFEIIIIASHTGQLVVILEAISLNEQVATF